MWKWAWFIYMWVLIVTLHNYLHFPGNCVDLMTRCFGRFGQHSSAPDHCCWGDNLEQAPRKNQLLCTSADPPVGKISMFHTICVKICEVFISTNSVLVCHLRVEKKYSWKRCKMIQPFSAMTLNLSSYTLVPLVCCKHVAIMLYILIFLELIELFRCRGVLHSIRWVACWWTLLGCHRLEWRMYLTLVSSDLEYA